MPVKFVAPEEWERLTGSRGSVYIGPARRPKPAKKSREVFLCPHCYELLASPRAGVFRCGPCGKTWDDPRAT